MFCILFQERHTLPSTPDAASAARTGKEHFALSLKVLFFPWSDLPGILCLAFVFFLSLVADEVERALRLAGFITFGRWMVWCGFTSYLQSLSRNLGSVLRWVLLVRLYILKKERMKMRKEERNFKKQILKENGTPWESRGIRRDAAEADRQHAETAFLSST